MKNNNIKSIISNENTLLFAMIAFCLIIFTIIKPSFLSMNSFESITKQIPEIGLFTFAMMIPMLVGGIDLSIIASANLSSILMTMFMNKFIQSGEDNILIVFIAILLCIGLCVFVGFINGLIVAKFNIPAMLVTLGTQMVLTGISLGITRGGTLSGYPESFKFIGRGNIGFIPTQFIIFILAAIVLYLVIQRTPFGIKLQMYGSNKVATIFSGINETSLLIKTHMLSGVYVGIAAIIMTSRLTSSSSGTAANYLMRAILIAVLGKVDPNGGKGKVSGVIIAVVLFQIVATGLNVLKVNAYIVLTLYGIILLASVLIKRKDRR